MSFETDRARRLSEYASKIAHHFERSLQNSSATPTPLALYRSLLASAKESSITIISIGFLTNLAALLSTPSDADSPQTGRDVVASKVKELVVMGGIYPDGGWEFNFAGADPSATKAVINEWPRNVPITFAGLELGRDILSGARLPELAPQDSPILAAYQWYVGRCRTARESWDPLAVLFGAIGLGSLPDKFDTAWRNRGPVFAYGNKRGYNHVRADGTNEWVDDAGVTNQHWLAIAEGWQNESVAALLDELLASSPPDRKEQVGRDEL